ncbi:MAG: hypothetical protein ACI9S8_001110 [Chlamydiales bacterium]|jgi:hypothetical protein
MVDGFNEPEKRKLSQATEECEVTKIELDHINIGKKALLTTPHKIISKEALKTGPFSERLRSTINSFVPNILSHWFIRKKILAEIPLKYLKEAISLLDKRTLPEVTFMTESGTLIPLNQEHIKAVLPEMASQKLEEILPLINQSSNPLFRENLLDSLCKVAQSPAEDTALLPAKKLHMALILLKDHQEKHTAVVKAIPNFLMRKLLPLLSELQIWKVIQNMDLDQLALITKHLSEETTTKLISSQLSFEKLNKIIPNMALTQIQTLVKAIVEDPKPQEEAKQDLLIQILKILSPQQLAAAVIQLNPRQRKILLGPYAHRPMGVTTAIANGKMKLYQIVAGVTHPLLTVDILNAVEWMNQQQILAAKSTLTHLALELDKQASNIRMSNEEEPIIERISFLLECCDEIKKLSQQKYHVLFKEIAHLAKVFDSINK